MSFSTLRTRLTLLYTSVLAGLAIASAVILVLSIWYSIEATSSRSLRVSTVQLANAYEFYTLDPEDYSNIETLIQSLREEDTTYCIYNDKLDIVDISEDYPIDKDVSFYLVQKYFSSSHSRDNGEIVDFDRGAESYKICTNAYVTNDGSLIMVQLIKLMSSQRAILQGPVVTAILVIITGIILSILIGNYLAKRSLEPIIQSYERQRTFIADASHELRTPLAVIMTNLEAALSQEESQGSGNKWIKNAFTEVKFARSVIEDLLFLAKADAGEPIITIKDVDISYIVLETSERLSLLCAEKDIKLKVDISDTELFVKGEEKLLSELLTIFIDNAIKYTNQGGKITISVLNTPDKIKVVIEDTGIGIEKEDQRKIFDRFYRVDKARSRKEGGTGLGLSIAQYIMNELNVSLSIKSEISEGTTFTLTFDRVYPEEL